MKAPTTRFRNLPFFEKTISVNTNKLTVNAKSKLLKHFRDLLRTFFFFFLQSKNEGQFRLAMRFNSSSLHNDTFTNNHFTSLCSYTQILLIFPTCVVKEMEWRWGWRIFTVPQKHSLSLALRVDEKFSGSSRRRLGPFDMSDKGV